MVNASTMAKGVGVEVGVSVLIGDGGTDVYVGILVGVGVNVAVGAIVPVGRDTHAATIG
jgi:hypothetical protein